MCALYDANVVTISNELSCISGSRLESMDLHLLHVQPADKGGKYFSRKLGFSLIKFVVCMRGIASGCVSFCGLACHMLR